MGITIEAKRDEKKFRVFARSPFPTVFPSTSYWVEDSPQTNCVLALDLRCDTFEGTILSHVEQMIINWAIDWKWFTGSGRPRSESEQKLTSAINSMTRPVVLIAVPLLPSSFERMINVGSSCVCVCVVVANSISPSFCGALIEFFHFHWSVGMRTKLCTEFS